MDKAAQQILPSYEVFVAAVTDAELGASLSTELLHGIYELAIQRCRYPRVAEDEAKLAAERRNTVNRLTKLTKSANALDTSARELAGTMQAESFNAQTLCRTTEALSTAIHDLQDMLDKATQQVIDSIHPSLKHGLRQKWETPSFGPYDLPRMGEKVADTWFLLSAGALLNEYLSREDKGITKKLRWDILKTFHKVLFHESIDARTIEQLIRSHHKTEK